MKIMAEKKSRIRTRVNHEVEGMTIRKSYGLFFKKILEIRSSNPTLREGFLLLFVYLIVFKFELYGNNEAVSCS